MTDYVPPAYAPPAACPRCGSSANVHTIREMLDMMTMAREQAIQRAQARGYNVPGAGPGAAPEAGPARPGFRVLGEGESPDAPRPGHWRTPPSRPARDTDFDFDGTGNLGDDIAGAAVAAGLGMLGRAIGKRMKKAVEERVIPAVQERAAQSQQEMEQVAARYPELRVCQHDQVVFLEGGHATVPLSEIRMPVTMAQADAVVARLRLPVVGDVQRDDGGGAAYRDARADRVLVEPPADAAAALPGPRPASGQLPAAASLHGVDGGVRRPCPEDLFLVGNGPPAQGRPG